MLKWSRIICALCIAMIIIIIFVTMALFPEDYIPIDGGQTAGLTGLKRTEAGSKVTLTATLEEPPPTILFRTTYSSVEVSLDGSIIYSYGMVNNRPFGKKPPRAFHFIDLDGADAGSVLEVTITDYRQTTPQIREIRGGTKADLIFYIIKSKIGSALYSLMFFFVGILLLYVYLFGIKAEMTYAFRRALYLSAIAFLVALWQGSECYIFELFFPYSYTLYAVSFLSLMLLPIPVLLFAAQGSDAGDVRLLKVALYANFFVCVALQVLSIVDFKESIIVSHALVLVTIVYGICFLIKHSIKKQPLLFAGLAALSLGTVIDLTLYYINNNASGFVFFNAGFALLFVLYIIQYVNEAFRAYTQNLLSKELLETRNREIIRTVEIQQNHYRQLTGQIDLNRRMNHDLRQFRTMLYGALRQDEPEKARGLIEQIDDIYENMQIQIYCDNVEIDALISYAQENCKKHNVEFIHSVRLSNSVGTIPIYDLCIVIGNLLDNAIEAASKCASQRVVEITAAVYNSNLVVKVENTYSGKLRADGGVYITTKEEAEWHGLGIPIVKRIMETSGGELSLKADKKQFTATVMWEI